MINLYRAFRTGLLDGLEQPCDLTVGMTYTVSSRQVAYDHGCNLGQYLGRVWLAVKNYRGER